MPVDVRTVAAAALGRPVTSARLDARTPVDYDPFLAGRSVDRVTGEATLHGGELAPWSAIVKHTSGPGLAAAHRELDAYLNGAAGERAAQSLHAPALLAHDHGPEHVELWLQELRDEFDGRWPIARYGAAARHIARWTAHIGSGRPSSVAPHFAWAEHHGQPDRVPAAVAELHALRSMPAAPEIMTLLDDAGFARTEAMIARAATIIRAVNGLPQTLLHHDLVRSNLFAVSGSATAAIDWETVGPGPVGVELAPLVVGSVRRGEASSDDLADLERLVLDEYEQARMLTGGPTVDVRGAYQLALGLRWHVVLGTIRVFMQPTATRIRGSRPDEPRAESLRHLIALSRHLLVAADSRTHRR